MAKAASNKKRKAQAAANQPTKKPATAATAVDVSNSDIGQASKPTTTDDNLIAGLVFPEELEATIEVLRTLAENPAALRSSKDLKGFKGAMWDCWRGLQEASGTGGSLTSRISAALRDSLHLEALVLLSELRLRGQLPKLGSLQRWVRECDAAAISAANKKRTAAEAEREEALVWQVLDALLRACGDTVEDVEAIGEIETDVKRGGKGVRRWKEWDVSKTEGFQGQAPMSRNVWKAVAEGSLVSEEKKIAYQAAVLALDTTPGPSRRPPNLFPAIVWHIPTPETLALSLSHPPATRHAVPGVPGALLLTDVMSHAECLDIISMSESVGLIEDVPAGGSATELNSILAHNLILLAPPQLLTPLFNRVKGLLPSHVPVPAGSKMSGALKGINSRFRIYRYQEGSVYRPHVDGAWPSSASSPVSADGLTPATYIYDSDLTLYSRYTFLLYLNDSFTNGCTTFFLPDPNRDGVLDARSVKPRAGSALVFPHGAAKGSLLHEGSPVFPCEQEGAKYVIRTEVLYEVDRIPSAGEGGVVGGLV